MLVIGVGNPDRGDDAVGRWVVEQLADSCATITSNGDPAHLIDAWRNEDDVVIVDATRCERTPGSITVVDLLDQRLPAAVVSSSHGLGPIEAVELAAAINALPATLTLVGIEGAGFEHGTPMDPAVRRGAARAVGMIESWMS